MKKVLLGCGVFVLLACVGIGSAFWFFVISPVQDFVGELAEVTEVWQEANSLEREVTNTEAFVPPTDGDLTQTQVDGFVAVQRAIEVASSQEGQEFREQLAEWDKQMAGEELNFMAAREQLARLPDVLRGLGTTYLALKQVQVDSLNAAGMSVEEYSWVRGTFYRALGYQLMPAEVSELTERAQQLTEGLEPGNVELNLDQVKGSMTPTDDRGSEVNRALVEPFATEATSWFEHAPFL